MIIETYLIIDESGLVPHRLGLHERAHPRPAKKLLEINIVKADADLVFHVTISSLQNEIKIYHLVCIN